MGTTAQKLQAILDSKADIAAAIQEKGGTVPTKLSEYGDAIRNIPAGTEELADVEFIDYDGRIVNRYMFAEASALSELPTLPSRTGFTNQGWNFTLSEVTSAASAENKITVGCTYITDDNTTRISLTIPDDDLTFSFNFGQTESKSVFLDWGDGVTDTPNSTTVSARKHTYPSGGDYTIVVTPLKDYATFYLPGNIGGSGAVVNNQKINDISIGKIVSAGGYLINGCDSISAFSIPDGTTIGNNIVAASRSLKAFVLPRSVTTTPSGVCSYCGNLSKVSIPPTTTAFAASGGSEFIGCGSLTNIRLPSVETVSTSAFDYCGQLKTVDAPALTTVKDFGFGNCGSLTKVNSNSITVVTQSGFIGCSSLTSIGTHSFGWFGQSGNNFSACCNLIEVGPISLSLDSRPTQDTNNPTIGTNCFANCKKLTRLVFEPDDDPAQSKPAMIISGAAFADTNILVFDFRACHQIPTLSNTSAFKGTAAEKKIIVPDSLYTNWIAAANWSSTTNGIKTAIVKASEA